MTIEQLQADYAALDARVTALENAGAHSHFESLLTHPNLHAQWTLRDNSHYINGRSAKYTTNPQARYDSELDAARVSLPPLSNELAANGGFVLNWGRVQNWTIGSRLVVQHDVLISQAMRDLAMAPGTNGRRTDGYKFTNVCRARGAISLELRTFFSNPGDINVDFRGYCQKLEGRQERDQLASDVANPTRTFFGAGGGYDRHPGPDSSWNHGANMPHPQQFKIRPDTWVRVTYEFHLVAEGCRVKVWMADTTTDPKLIIASPIDPSLGFLTDMTEPMESLYIELDTSQETTYAAPMPERWCAFRNLVVLPNVTGETVLGGRPK